MKVAGVEYKMKSIYVLLVSCTTPYYWRLSIISVFMVSKYMDEKFISMNQNTIIIEENCSYCR